MLTLIMEDAMMEVNFLVTALFFTATFFMIIIKDLEIVMNKQ